MEALNKLARYLQNLNQKQFQRHILLFLGSVALVAASVTYFIYQKKYDLAMHIKQLQTLTERSFKMIANNRKMIKDEVRFKEILDKNKDFTMKGFFEQFYREQNITPETGWDARAETVNERFDEITLPASFKGQTTEKLVKILDTLDKKEIVYIKELKIRNEGGQKIGFDIMLATKKYKSMLD